MCSPNLIIVLTFVLLTVPKFQGYYILLKIKYNSYLKKKKHLTWVKNIVGFSKSILIIFTEN